MIVLWGSARVVELPLEQLRFDPDPLALNCLPIATVKATVGVAKGGWEPPASVVSTSEVGAAEVSTSAITQAGANAVEPRAICPRTATRRQLPYWVKDLAVELAILGGLIVWTVALGLFTVALTRS